MTNLRTPTLAASDPAGHPAARAPWTSWRGVILLVIATTLIRIAFITWLCPFDLSGDEAQYWDWSRRLDWSYYSKGPGVAWTIAPSTALFGDHAWAVRLPAVLWAIVATLALARLTMEVAAAQGADRAQSERAAFFGAVAFTVFPGFQYSCVGMTIDGPHVACWILAGWAALRAFKAWHEGRSGTAAWIAFGVAMGVGFLFKYTIAVLIPGVLAFAVIHRRGMRCRAMPVAAATMVFLILISPVIYWNAARGWPTFHHLIGRVGLPGGDNPNVSAAFEPKTVLRFIGTQLAIVNIGVILIALALRRRHVAAATDKRGSAFPARSLMIALALPVLIFYLGTSFIGKVQPNWPLPGYATLLVIAAATVAQIGPSEAALRRWWKAWVALGAAAFLASMLAGPLIAITGVRERIPSVGRAIAQLQRGSRLVIEVAPPAQRLHERFGQAPTIVADRYMTAALLAFYLPGQPRVCSGESRLGGRPSSYDYFADTNLADPARVGGPIVMYGGVPQMWNAIFLIDEFEQPDVKVPVFTGIFRGIRNSPHGPAPSR